MSSFDISLRSQITIWKIGDLPIFLILQLGINHASSSITQELRFCDFPLSNYNSKWSASLWGPCAQITFGSTVRLGEFTVLFEGGYRQTSNVVSEEIIESSAGKDKMGGIWNIGLNGFVFLVSLEMKL
jgi:hypothetical protein